jgi:hypothetical protein
MAGMSHYDQVTSSSAEELHRGLCQMVFEIMEADNGQLPNYDDDAHPSG